MMYPCIKKGNIDEVVKSPKIPFFVIPAPHQVRDKLRPVEDAD